MKNKRCFTVFIFFFGVIFIGCNNNFSDLYKKMINEKQTVFLEHSDYSSSVNKLYLKICKMGKKNNDRLLELAINENKTNWITNFSYQPLTDGDLAISLLIDINEISDVDFKFLMPSDIRDEYEEEGGRIFWDWIHEDIANRKYVIIQLKKIIN